MPRPLATPEVVFVSQRHRGEGATLTRNRAASIASDLLTEHRSVCAGAECVTCKRASTLLDHAARSLLRSKRSRAMGPVNGRRNYTGRDRRSVAPAGEARLHGSKVGTRA